MFGNITQYFYWEVKLISEISRQMTSKTPFGIVILLTLFSGCDLVPDKKDVVGTYNGVMFGVHETIVINEDGTFAQTLVMPSGKILTTSGNWKLVHRVVEFDSYLLFYGAGMPKALKDPPEKFSYVSYIWESNSLVQDWVTGGYVLQKPMPLSPAP